MKPFKWVRRIELDNSIWEIVETEGGCAVALQDGLCTLKAGGKVYPIQSRKIRRLDRDKIPGYEEKRAKLKVQLDAIKAALEKMEQEKAEEKQD